MPRVSPATWFIYSIIMTILAFVIRSEAALLIPAIPNFIVGLILALKKKYYLFPITLLLAFWALFLNAVLFVNYGKPVLILGPIIIRENALWATLIVAVRLMTITGAAMIFVSMINPRELIISLERQLGLPKGLAFALSLAIRLIPLMTHDYHEILFIRRQRGYRTKLLIPTDVVGVLLPLVAVGIDRAYWIGIAAELRGFQLRKRRFKPEYTLWDILVIAVGILQTIVAVAIVFLQ